jgi:hypothetical protein
MVGFHQSYLMRREFARKRMVEILMQKLVNKKRNTTWRYA